MAGAISFNVSVKIEGNVLPEIQERAADLTPAFEAIIREWVDLNKQKFEAAKGRESSGAQIDEDVFWQALSPKYIEQKHPMGAPVRARKSAGTVVEYPSWIMVRTGALMTALTNPDMIFQYVTAQDAVFGVPLDPELAAIVGYQWVRRQAIFLGTADQNAIRRIVQDYLQVGPDFENVRMSTGMQRVSEREEVARMDAEFTNDMSSEAGDWGGGDE